MQRHIRDGETTITFSFPSKDSRLEKKSLFFPYTEPIHNCAFTFVLFMCLINVVAYLLFRLSKISTFGCSLTHCS